MWVYQGVDEINIGDQSPHVLRHVLQTMNVQSPFLRRNLCNFSAHLAHGPHGPHGFHTISLANFSNYKMLATTLADITWAHVKIHLQLPPFHPKQHRNTNQAKVPTRSGCRKMAGTRFHSSSTRRFFGSRTFLPHIGSAKSIMSDEFGGIHWQLVFQATRNLGYLHFTHPFVHCIFKLCSANWLSIVYRLLASPTKHVLFLIPQRFQVLPLPVGSYSECVCVCLYIHIYINIYILIIYTNMKNQGYICIFLC